ncbi:MAG: hypothetical protein ACRDY6_00170 [Acidimicrobiia bacterium]
MTVEEQRVRIRRSLEEKLGVEEAAYLVEGRPPGGWDALVTKDYLDLRLGSLGERMELRLAATAHELRAEFRDQTTRMIKWFVPTVFAGMSISSALIAGAFATLA